MTHSAQENAYFVQKPVINTLSSPPGDERLPVLGIHIKRGKKKEVDDQEKRPRAGGGEIRQIDTPFPGVSTA